MPASLPRWLRTARFAGCGPARRSCRAFTRTPGAAPAYISPANYRNDRERGAGSAMKRDYDITLLTALCLLSAYAYLLLVWKLTT